jgi:hypothetical protein
MESNQTNVPMQPWQLDRIRAKVQKMRGELTIRIYAPPDMVFKIWYNPNDNVALYGREQWSEAEGRDRLRKAWRDEILRVIRAGKARINVLYKNGVEIEEWFGPESDMKPLKDAYDYITNIEKHARNTIDALLPTAHEED